MERDKRHKESTKKRILLIAACPFPGNRGTPSRILKMAEALGRKGHKVTVLSYFNRDFEYESDLIDIVRVPRIPFYNDNSPGPKFMKIVADLFLISKARSLLRKSQFDIAHCHHLEGGLVGFLSVDRKKTNFVYDSHIILSKEITSYGLFSLLEKPLTWLENLLYKKADLIVYVDGEIREYAKKLGYDSEENIVLPTGTNIDEVLDITKNSTNPFNIKKQKSIVYTGSIAKFQKVEDIVEVSTFFNPDSEIFYMVTGMGKEKGAYLEEKVKKLGVNDRIKFVYNQSFADQLSYVKFADILLSPRDDCAGLPQKLTNYMAFNKKIVASTGSAKILSPENSYLYSGRDIAQFRKQLSKALNDSSNKRARLAFDLVKTYDWDELVKVLDESYSSLLFLRRKNDTIATTNPNNNA